jgi:hypothetical protein
MGPALAETLPPIVTFPPKVNARSASSVLRTMTKSETDRNHVTRKRRVQLGKVGKRTRRRKEAYHPLRPADPIRHHRWRSGMVLTSYRQEDERGQVRFLLPKGGAFGVRLNRGERRGEKEGRERTASTGEDETGFEDGKDSKTLCVQENSCKCQGTRRRMSKRSPREGGRRAVRTRQDEPFGMATTSAASRGSALAYKSTERAQGGLRDAHN